MYTWKGLSEVGAIDIEKYSAPMSPPLINLDDEMSSLNIEGTGKIKRVCNTRAEDQLLIQHFSPNNAGRDTFTSILQLSPHPSAPRKITIPEAIQSRIEIPLGILSRNRLVYLDKNYWMCIWSIGTSDELENVDRPFFLPTDWRNMDCLELCTLLPDGAFMIPNNGELAFIRCMGLSSR